MIKVRPLAGFEFGMEQFSIGADFEGAAAGRNQRKRFDAVAEFENFGRQTDGLRRVVSNDAVFYGNFGFHRNNSFPQPSYRRAQNGSRVMQGLSPLDAVAERGA